MNAAAYRVFLVYVVSFFLHVPGRLTFLGTIRFDVILVGLITGFALMGMNESRREPDSSGTNRILWILLGYILLSLPVVEWPGSVLDNLQTFIKGVSFYFFTVALIDSEKRLRTFLNLFILCQLFRVAEPLYLNLTEGYWGSETWLEGGAFMDRLSGSPYDVINPNGLAFVIVTVIPLLHFTAMRGPKLWKLVYLVGIPMLLYALVLTSSRSGFLAVLLVFGVAFFKSRRKGTFGVILLLGGVFFFASLSDLHRERYLSLFRDDVRGAHTASGRIDGIVADLRVVLNRPIVGHGLGTSAEANFNVRGAGQRSHNLYAEILQELGVIGFVIFLAFMRSVIVNFAHTRRLVISRGRPDTYVARMTNALQTWLWMNILFSFASFGLSSYEWYLFGGLSVCVLRLASRMDPLDEPESTPEAARGGRASRAGRRAPRRQPVRAR